MKNDKSLGQHWLYNRAILDEIAELTEVGMKGSAYVFFGGSGEKQEKKGVCVEIGPGLGTLTASLFKRFDKIIAVEYDERLAKNLPGSFPGKNLKVINEDILKYDFKDVANGEPYCVAGNIPYYITSPILKKILRLKNPPERVVLLMQKEVAERVCSEKESVLSLFVKNRAKVGLGVKVPREEFTPAPKVDSQVLILEPSKDGAKYPEEMFKLIKVAFLSPRKKLIHNLTQIKEKNEIMETFKELKISLGARPADLNLEKYYELYVKIMQK